jgi:hypothetical protein
MKTAELLSPPADVPDIQRGNWLDLPPDDPVTNYLAVHQWDRSERPASWQVARLSHAVHIYREQETGWTVAAKFYTVKTGKDAERHAKGELGRIQRARAACPEDGDLQVIRPLAVWRGILFQEYVDGLTLEDTIAVRRSRPGTLAPSLDLAAQLLATFHACTPRPEGEPDFGPAEAYARKVMNDLAKWGVLQGDPVVVDGLSRLVGRWGSLPSMTSYVPTGVHGDATTSNFVYPPAGGVVAMDWERSHVTDPAYDLGRLMAEVSHSINQHGGDVAEALFFVRHLVDAYRRALPAGWDADALVERARFFRASSTLRIARNGWVPRLDRMALVAQAMSLLA